VKRFALTLAAVASVLIVAAVPAYASGPLAWSPIPTRVSPINSPYPLNCAQSTSGTNFPGTEVEPWVAVNPADADNAIAVWQQDRYSNGGSKGLRAAFSQDGQWTNPVNQPGFSRCAGGSGDTGGYERATDPWVAFNSDGSIAYFMSLSLDVSQDNAHAMTVSRSLDGGAHWEATPKVLRRDTSLYVLNDKNSLSADRFNPNFAYAIWDRLVFPNEKSKGQSFENAGAFYGPTWFTRTTDGGNNWDEAHIIWDPGQEHHNSGRNDQSIGNQIVQTGNGVLVDVFDWLSNDNAGGKPGGGRKGAKVAVLRSTDSGATWSDHAIVVSGFTPGTVHDPTTGDLVRTGDIIPEIAVDPRTSQSPANKTVYVVWQAASADSPSSIYFSKSIDAGQTWSAPTVINTVTSTQAFTPSVRVDSNGAIAVTYYDFRNDTSSTPLWTDYWSIVSRDGGQTWQESHVDGPFDHRGAPRASGLFLGDYEGLDAGNSNVFRAVFGKATGTFETPASDIEESEAQETP
jgi:BNR/Asp-box repeat